MQKNNIEQFKNIELTDLAENLGINRKGNSGNWECFDTSHQNQQAKPSLSITNEQGYYCHKCGMKGTDAIGLYQAFKQCTFSEALQGLAQLYNISIKMNQLTPIKSPKHSDLLQAENYLKYAEIFKEQKSVSAQKTKRELENRKISFETAVKYNIAIIENLFIPQIAKYNKTNQANLKTNYDVIAFPMYNAQKEYTGLKYRLFKNDFEKIPNEIGIKKSMAISGSKTGLIYDEAEIETAEEILLCEGEIDGLSLASLGFENVVINLGGVGNCMEMIKTVCKDKKIISFYDNDQAGQTANKKLSETINRPVFVVKLSLAEGKTKTDLNDKILEGWQQSDFETIIQKAEKIEGKITEKDSFLNYLNTKNDVKSVYSTGIIDDQFYHLVYCPDPYILFSNKTFAQVKDSSFEFEQQIFKLKQNPIPTELNNSINSISKNRIADFISGKQACSKEEIFTKLINTLNAYYDFYEDNEAYVVASHIIHTYLLGIFGKTVYLLLAGEKGTGKSSLQLLMSKLQFNGNFAGKSSVPVTVRKVHCYQCALNLDELEKISKDEKKIMIGVFNTGYTQGGTYEITDMNQKETAKQIKQFFTFSAKTFSVNNLKGFDDSLMSRCFTINTVKNEKSVEDIHDQKPEKEKLFQGIRDDLFVYCLEHWKEIQDYCQTTKEYLSDRKIMGRIAESLAILGGIYMYFTNNETFLDYLIEHENFDEDEKKNERAEIVFDFLEERINCNFNNKQELEFTNQELVDEINKKIDVQEQYKATANSVASLLRSYRIIDSKNAQIERITSGINKGKTKYYVKLTHLVRILKNQGRFADFKYKQGETEQDNLSPEKTLY